MSRKRTWTDERFVEAAKTSISASGVLKLVGLGTTGANFEVVRKTVKRLGIDTSHWLGQAHMKGRSHSWTKRKELRDVMVQDSCFGRFWLKTRLLKEGLLKNECVLCGQGPEWKGKPLVMVLDHINGVSNDHRLDNLRMLCPNCNSQQDTFAGRANKGKTPRIPREEFRCGKCGRVLSCRGVTGLCSHCRERGHPEKRAFDKAVVECALKEGIRETARRHRMSPCTVKKWVMQARVLELA